MISKKRHSNGIVGYLYLCLFKVTFLTKYYIDCTKLSRMFPLKNNGDRVLDLLRKSVFLNEKYMIFKHETM